MIGNVEEVWFNIIGFSSYKISNLGNVMSYKTKSAPRKLIPSRTGDAFLLLSDTGDRRVVTKNRLLYATKNGVPYDSIVGFVVGPVHDLKNISKKEFYNRLSSSGVAGGSINADDVEQFYEETANDISMVRQFYKTGDISALAEYIHKQERYAVRYTMKAGRCCESVARDVWSEVQEYILLGLCAKSITVMNIRKYIARSIRTKIAQRKRKTTREVNFNEYTIYDV